MEKFKRFEILIDLLARKPYRSKKEVLDYFETHHDLPLSARTLERDFQALETEFHIGITYDRGRQGYHLMDGDRDRVADFLKFAGRLYLADLLRKGLKDFKDLQACIKLEDHSEFEGIRFLEPLFLAIQKNRTVDFVHYNYHKDTQTNYRIAPLQLREYQGRWYVVGVPLDNENRAKPNAHIKTFGLARLSSLKIAGASPILASDFEKQLEKFTKIIGLNYDGGEKREWIEIAVSKNQYKYLKSLPLHPSQEREGNLPDGRVKISLHLIPNYELRMQLLKFGDQVEVLQPQSLRKELKQTLKNALKPYKNE